MAKAPKIMVFRFSALGDIALLVPVFRALFKTYPQLQLILVSRPFVQPIFEEFDRLSFVPMDPEEVKGIRGIFRFYRQLRRLRPTAVADLHSVLRTHLLRLLFQFSGTSVQKIDKGRTAKKQLTRPQNKRWMPLQHTVFRYADVFFRLGWPVEVPQQQEPQNLPLPENLPEALQLSKQPWIGIAPFASFPGKCYPLDALQKVMAYLAQNHQLLLFGAGPQELSQMEVWAKAYPNVFNICKDLNFKQQLQLISHLDLMIAMDSANGHLAANSGVFVLSLWGLTHPYAGFAPFGQGHQNLTADREKFPQIPTSVYGNKMPAGYENAFRTIAPQVVIEKALEMLKDQTSS